MAATSVKKNVRSEAGKALNYIKALFLDTYARKSWSQEGEDLVLKRMFEYKEKGFYVDVGAHHPKRFSNTFLFYRAGWQGINIDAMPGSMMPFKKMRPRDISLEVPVSEKPEILTYYAFNEPALNGFSKEISQSRNGLRDYRIIFEKELQTQSLSQILDAHLPAGQAIDFLSIDVEGFDFAVLRSNDWGKYKPEVVLVEVLGTTLEEIMHSDIALFMQDKGYGVYAKTFNTVFFKRQDQNKQANHDA